MFKILKHDTFSVKSVMLKNALNLKHDTFSVKSVMLKNALNNNQRKKTKLFNIVMIDVDHNSSIYILTLRKDNSKGFTIHLCS